MLLDKLESGIVALETECGPVYVQPSGWERLYLLWTFRHFNSLPLKTLNSRQRKLVERLPRCSVRNPRIGLDRMQVIGTVEGAKAPSFSVSLPSETALHDGPPETVFTPAEIFAHSSSSDSHEESSNLDEGSKIQPSSLARRRGHSKIGFTLAIAALIAVFAVPTWHRLQSAQTLSTPETAPTPVAESGTTVVAKVVADQNNTAAAPIEVSSPSVDQPTLTQTAQPADTVATLQSDTTVAAPKLSIETPAAIISPLKPQPNQSTIKQTPADDRPIKIRSRENLIPAGIQEGKVQEETQRILFSGPPQRLIYPEYPDTKVRGKVNLKAVIGEDGRVREVKILSGNKLLSAAAARAIRQWRYEPFLKDGQRVEAETNVGVLFVAEDVISVSFPQPTVPISQ